ncbi:MAG: peptide ABC transporter substrate-binding protein, partial [Longimicrobiales bacterium]|nr:peptide ABC transporter substrate-binding protein [Longimicrobiales bacterium]
MNAAWLEIVLCGIDLLAWTRRLLLQGTALAACEPGELAAPTSAPTPAAPATALSPGAIAPESAAAPSAPGTVARGVLRMAGANPNTLDPALSQDVSSWSYLLQVYSGLVSLDDHLEVVPELASSWDVSADGLTYTFHLRPEARFHDGRPVTADDFRYSLERVLDPRLRSPVAATYLGDLAGARDRLRGQVAETAGIKVLDAHTLQLTIDAPKPYFLAKLTYPTAYVVDRADVQRGERWFEHPNGTGPFKLQSWERDSRVVLAANDAYYKGPPMLSRVEYWLGPGSAISLYEQDQLDVVEVGPANLERVTDPRGALSRELLRVPQFSLTYGGMNVTQPPFDDPKVRLAFAYATDKRRLADVLMKKMRLKADGILPPGMPGHDPSLVGLEFSPEKARQALAESRYGSPGRLPELTLTMGSGGGGLGETFAEMYRRNLGVELNVEE